MYIKSRGKKLMFLRNCYNTLFIGTPDIPGNFFSTEISHNSVKFKLETGFFNGSPQTLVIEYRKPESTLEWIIGASQMAGTAKNDLIEVSVVGLEPEATYEFKAFAHNEFGRSNYTDVIKATLKAGKIIYIIIK